MSWTVAKPRATSPTRAEAVAWIVLLVAVSASRWAVAPEVLYEWDSANYALAISDFDIYEHRPHPPGSPGFVLLLRLCSVVPGATGPFLAANAILGGATLVLVGGVVRREVGPGPALCTALALAVCPQFWQQGALSTAYVAECFCSVATLAAALQVARGSWGPLAGAIACAAVLSVRPSALPALLPVAVAGTALARVGAARAATAAVAYVLVVASWSSLAIATGGGLDRYHAASSALVAWQIASGSVLDGDLEATWDRARHLALYLVDAVNLLLLLPLLAVPRLPTQRTVALWLAWTLPALAVYVLHHLAKSAYVLTLVPAILVALALATGVPAGRFRRRALGVVAAAYVAWNVLAFLVAVPADGIAWRGPRSTVVPVTITGDYGRGGIAWRTAPTRKTSEILRSLDPVRDLAVWLFGTFESHRLAMAEFPDHALLAASIDHRRSLLLPPGPDAPTTFGDFQRVVLRAPSAGGVLRQPVRLDLVGDRILELASHGRSMEVELRRTPARIFVFVACPPCEVTTGARLVRARTERLAPDLAVTELDTPEVFP